MEATQTVSHVVPQSKLAIVIPIPEQSPKPITKAELEDVLLLRNALRQRQAQLALLEDGIQSRLETGATVEVGGHVAELKDSFRKGVSWRAVAERLADRLYDGKGAGYCANVLANTKPNRTVNLVIE